MHYIGKCFMMQMVNTSYLKERLLGRPRHRREYNIKIDLRGSGMRGCGLD
jgi:hypothetical protein